MFQFTVLALVLIAVSGFSQEILDDFEQLPRLEAVAQNTSDDSAAARPALPFEERPQLEWKTGYFYFADAKMRKIYPNGGLDLQLTGSYPVWRSIHAYISVEYLSRSGKSLNGHQRTSLWMLPINAGFKGILPVSKRALPYFSFGPRYFFLHQHNQSSYVEKTVCRNGIGFFANTGVDFIISDYAIIDIFGEYSYAITHPTPPRDFVYGEQGQIGGLTFGVGLGYLF